MPTDEELLGVLPGATREQVKAAYRKLVKRFHPDRLGSDDARDHAFFGRITEAYKRKHAEACAASAAARARPQAARPPPRPAPNPSAKQVVPDGHAELSCTFSQSYTGCSIDFSFRHFIACRRCQGSGFDVSRRVPVCQTCGGRGHFTFSAIAGETYRRCGACHGTGRWTDAPRSCYACLGVGQFLRTATVQVRVPAGVQDGQVLRLRGCGNDGPCGESRGDLFIHLHVQPHPHLTRRGQNIVANAVVSHHTMTVGGVFSVESATGPVNVRIPPGVRDGHVVRLRGLGFPDASVGTRGDMLLTLMQGEQEVPESAVSDDPEPQFISRCCAHCGSHRLRLQRAQADFSFQCLDCTWATRFAAQCPYCGCATELRTLGRTVESMCFRCKTIEVFHQDRAAP